MSSRAELANVALRIDRRGLDEDVLDFAAVAAGIHAQRASDRAGNAAQEFQAGDSRFDRGPGDGGIESRSASAHARAIRAQPCPSFRTVERPRREYRHRE